METEYRLDWETRSTLDLAEVGLSVYMEHPSTEIIMANYCRGDGKIQRWEPHLQSKIPAELEDALLDPFVVISAWGASFERAAAKHLLGIDKPASEWYCTMSHARYLSLPGKLHDAGEILGIGEAAKLRTGGGTTGKGAALIRFFCEPESLGGEETLFGISKPAFRDWRTHPKEWATFCDYGGQDVVAERAVAKKLAKFPWPESEREVWVLDQKINETGWPVDHSLVDGAAALVERELHPLVQQIRDISGVDNPNSRDQLLGWLQTQGYGFSSLNKDFVLRAKTECELTPEAKEVLALREQTSKSSVSKYTALAHMTSADGRLRYAYTYYGAHTGRWTSHGTNAANFPKPTKQVEKNLYRAVELVQTRDYEAIVREFGKPLEVASSVLRSAFRAPAGKKFVVCDLNAIENRGLGYLARCEAILDVFRQGRDPYLDFAAKMYGLTYEEVLAEYEAGHKEKRTLAKAPVLGCGYALGPGTQKIIDGNTIWTGLMGYAQKMGIEMTLEQATEAVKVFRASYSEVKQLWKDMEQASVYATRHPGEVIGVGVPQTQREKEYFESKNRKVLEPVLHFKATGSKVLEMLLPSGRSLFYLDPRVVVEDKEYQGRQYKQDVLYHKAKDQKTKQWVEVPTHGGPLVENADQAISRDILVHGMRLADKKGFEIVGNTYDEIITLAPVNGNLGIEELAACMEDEPTWTGGNFPLGASGFEDSIYRKD